MRKYKIKEIAQEISIRIDDPKHSDYEKFVGLEHYDSGKVMISRFGDASKLDSSVKTFKKGDVLIARRNVYLKRASLVDFDGVTSGDSIVIRANDDSFRGLLPFIFNTDAFWNYATQYADGSMSKRLSPQKLLEFEVNLPENEDERIKISKILWNMYETMSSYEKVIQLSDNLVKSQFIEMFGEIGKDEKGWGLTTLGKCCELNPKRPKDIDDKVMVSFVPMPAVSDNGKIDCSEIKPYRDVRKGFTYFAENDVIFAKITPCMENGKGAIARGLAGGIGSGSTEFHILRPIIGKSNPYWLYVITKFKGFRDGAKKVMTGTGGQLRVPIGFLRDYHVSLPPIELQNDFEKFVQQVDKSKFYIEKLIQMQITIWQKGGKIYANI